MSPNRPLLSRLRPETARISAFRGVVTCFGSRGSPVQIRPPRYLQIACKWVGAGRRGAGALLFLGHRDVVSQRAASARWAFPWSLKYAIADGRTWTLMPCVSVSPIGSSLAWRISSATSSADSSTWRTCVVSPTNQMVHGIAGSYLGEPALRPCARSARLPPRFGRSPAADADASRRYTGSTPRRGASKWVHRDEGKDCS